MGLKVVGKPVNRRDAVEKVTGRLNSGPILIFQASYMGQSVAAYIHTPGLRM